MDLSKRIREIAVEIKYPSIIDIGTDHCYIPIYGRKKGIIQKAIACDIKKGPLLAAEKNVSAYGYDQDITLRLSDGFEHVRPGEGECAIIAGMGGMLIAQILKDAGEKLAMLKQLILQPQSHMKEVRQIVLALGFFIENEKVIYDSGKYYCIINCMRGSSPTYHEKDLVLGKVLPQRRDPVYLAYLTEERKKTQKILNTINQNASFHKTKEIMEKVASLASYLTLIEEVLFYDSPNND